MRRAAEVILAREVLPGPTPLPDFERLLDRGSRWARARGDRRGGKAVVAVSVAGLVLVSTFALVLVLVGRRDVSYTVEGPVVVSGSVVEALASAARSTSPPARMRFSEGSEIALSEGARLRVASRGIHGAALVLERGHAGLSVTHRLGAAWSVTSGPFTIEVVGTTFSLDWSPTEERMVVDLTAGRIRVRGASEGGPIEMSGGERLVASVRDHRVTLAPLGAPAPWSGAGAAAGGDRRALGQGLDRGDPLAEDAVAASGAPTRTAVGGGRRALDVALALASPSRAATGRSPDRRAPGARSERAPNTLAGGSSEPSNLSAPTPPAVATPYLEFPAWSGAPDLRPSTFAAPVVPNLTLGGGGVFCSRETAQYRFEQPEDGISVANLYTLALANPDLDNTHSWCGVGAVRLRASFTDQGRRNYFGRYQRETGQLIIRLDRPTDFTGRTVTMHVFVEGPSDARFSAEIFVVHQGHWVGSEPMRELSPGRWWTVKHTFKALNPTGGADSSNPMPYPGEGMSPVSACNRVSLAIRTTGARRNWTGAVYVDDVGWR